MSNFVFNLFGSKAILDNDGTLGPKFDSWFDFTLSFEDVVFSIVPASIFVCCLPHYILKARRSAKVARAGYLFWAKLIAGVLLLSTQVASLIVWASSDDTRTTIGIASRAVSCLASLCILVTLYTEHFYSPRPSLLLGLYLVITLLFDIVKIRSAFLRDAVSDGSLAIGAIVLRFVLIILEEIPKRSLFISHEKQVSANKESIGGFCSRAVFVWLFPLFHLGYNSRITVEDLDELSDDMQVSGLDDCFREHWDKENKASKYALLKAILLTIGLRRLLLPVALSLLNVASIFSQPFIINKVVTLMSSSTMDANEANGLIGATLLSYLIFALSRAAGRQGRIQVRTILRSCLSSALFDQIMALYAADVNSGAFITRLTSDINVIEQFIDRVLEVVPNVASLVAGVVYLGFTVGAAAFLAVIPIIAATLLSWLIGLQMKPAQAHWNGKIEERLSVLHDLLSNIKSLRMTGFSGTLADTVRKRLIIEVDASNKYRFYLALVFAIELASIAMTPALILIGAFFWTRTSQLTVGDIYALLTVASLITMPLAFVSHAFKYFASGFAGHDRIQEFLLCTPRNEAREYPSAASSSEKHIQTRDYSAHLDKSEISPAVGSKYAFEGADTLFPAKQLTAIVGPIGSGKTTLLKMLVGELPSVQNKVRIDVSQVAFCAQTPWVRNQPVRDFIVGHYENDDTWYQSVVKACNLDIDFASWPQGDLKVAGNEGQNLSGGQKHRIALAKAIFSRKKILIVDDIFSGLDRTTAKKGFESLFGADGLLRQAETTVILATNLREHLQYADSVLGIDSNRKISKLDKATAMDAVPSPALIESATTNEPVSATASQSGKDSKQSDDSTSKTTKQDRPVTPGRGTYTYYFSSFGIVTFIVWQIWIAMGEAFFKAPNIFIRGWIETHSIDGYLFLGFTLIGVAAVIFSVFSIWFFFVRMVATSYKNIHNNLLDATVHAQTQFLSKTDNGSLLNRFSSDMTLITHDLSLALMYCSMFSFAVVIDLVIIACGAYYVAIVFPVFLGILAYAQQLYLRTSRQMRVLEIEARTPLITLVNETMAGIEQIRTSQWTSVFKQDLLKKLDYSQKAFYAMNSIQQWLFLMLDMSVVVLATALVAIALHIPHSSSANGLGLALVNMIGMSMELGHAMRYWAEGETCLGAVTRTREFQNTTPQEPVNGTNMVQPSWPEQGEIEFSSVSAQYGVEGSGKVLSDVSFVAKAGQKVGIVGRTGSGKSTLLTAILQMLPYEGSIRIDGQELSAIQPDIIRSRITTLTQSSMLLSGTVRYNLNPSEEYFEDSTMIGLLTRLNIWSHILDAGGLDAIMTDIKLSDGQRQVVNIARGVLHHQRTGSKLALMDEITSHVDYETDKVIQTVIAEEFKGSTVLVIAHRAETLHDADKILTVADGKVI